MSTGHAFNNSLPFYEQEAVGVMAGIGDPLNWINIITPEFDAAFYRMIFGLDRAETETTYTELRDKVKNATGFVMTSEQGSFDLTIDTSNKMKFIISSGLAMTKDGYRCTKLSASEFDLTQGMAQLGGTQTIYVYGLAIQNHESIVSKLLQARIGVTSSTIAAQLAKQTESDPNCDYFGIIVSETMDVSIASQVHPVSEGANVYILPFWKLTVKNGTGITGYTDLRNAGQTVTLSCPLYAYQAVHLNGEVSDRTICPTQPVGTNNLTIANTQFVQNEIVRQINASNLEISDGTTKIELRRKSGWVYTNNVFSYSSTTAAEDALIKFRSYLNGYVLPVGFRPKNTTEITISAGYYEGDTHRVYILKINTDGTIESQYGWSGFTASENNKASKMIISFSYQTT